MFLQVRPIKKLYEAQAAANVCQHELRGIDTLENISLPHKPMLIA